MVHFGYGPLWLWVTRIILRPLSVLSLDEAKRNITTGLFGLGYGMKHPIAIVRC
jgi:hypothetical protein